MCDATILGFPLQIDACRWASQVGITQARWRTYCWEPEHHEDVNEAAGMGVVQVGKERSECVEEGCNFGVWEVWGGLETVAHSRPGRPEVLVGCGDEGV